MLGKAPKPAQDVLWYQQPTSNPQGGGLWATPNFSATGAPMVQLSSSSNLSSGYTSYGIVESGGELFCTGFNQTDSTYMLFKASRSGVDPYLTWQPTWAVGGSYIQALAPRRAAFYSSVSTSGGYHFASICTRSDASSTSMAQLITYRANGNQDGVAWAANEFGWSVDFNGAGVSPAVTPALCSNIIKTADGKLIFIYRVGATGAFRRRVIGPVSEDLAATVATPPATGAIRFITMMPSGSLYGFDQTGGTFLSSNHGVTWSKLSDTTIYNSTTAYNSIESQQSPYSTIFYDTATTGTTGKVQAVTRAGAILPSQTLNFVYGVTDIFYWGGYWIVLAKNAAPASYYYRTKKDIFTTATTGADFELMSITGGNGFGSAAMIPWK